MDDLLWARVAASVLVDGTLAAVCGLLLAGRWLSGLESPRWHGDRKGLQAFASVLAVASGVQLLLLATSFSERMDVRTILRSLPDICATHTGGMLLAQCAAAVVLLATTWISRERVREAAEWVAVLCCLGLHGAMGHAAVDGLLSWTEGLQWLHLLGMALWSGGVMVSGFAVVPALGWAGTAQTNARAYMAQLSTVSTWSVTVVLLSGAAKSFRTTGGTLGPIWVSRWGHLLLAKLVLVSFAVLLGARNRWLLAAPGLRGASTERKAARTLRAEAICMAGVLVLSAWLANSAPPLD